MYQAQTTDLVKQLNDEAKARRARMAQAAVKPRQPDLVRFQTASGVTKIIPRATFDRMQREVREQKAAMEAAREKMMDEAIAAREKALSDALAAVSGMAGVPRAISARIIAEVAEKHGMTVAMMLTNGRAHKGSYARQEACYRMREETTLSLKQIGRAMGGIDHTTVLHGHLSHKARLTGCDPERLVKNRDRMRGYHIANMAKAREAKRLNARAKVVARGEP